MSASPITARTFPGANHALAALGAIAVAVAIALLFVFGQITAPKAAQAAPAGAVPAANWDHGASSDVTNVPLVRNETNWDHGASSDVTNVPLVITEGSGGSNRFRLPR